MRSLDPMPTSHGAEAGGPAARRWAAGLAARAIPEHILAAAPETPHRFDVGRFARLADEAVHAQTPSTRAARDALPPGGSVLDVGCGAGAASLPLAPPAGLLIGCDESKAMLDAFAERARARGVAHRVLEGRWPAVAGGAPSVDVAVCHHVVYNVSDITSFLLALDAHARRRVVVELTDGHPLAWLRPYWAALHGIDMPDGPNAGDLLAVADELGLRAEAERWTRPLLRHSEDEEAVATFVRRRLCLPAAREPEVRDLLADQPPPSERAAATLWWTPTGA